MVGRVCTNCVMDESDSRITFDSNGICDHCRDYYENILPYWDTGEKGFSELSKVASAIRAEGQGKDFDCLVGMSGGADSSYMLHYVTTELGLRPLVFHVDGGWNSQIAVNNIEKLVDGLNLDLFTEVIDWQDMKAFQLAYLRSGLSNVDIPQDHAFIATLYDYAEKYKIKYILNGGNISTECVRNPLEWVYYGTDMRQIKALIRRFCDRDLDGYPFSNVLRHKLYLRYIKGVKVFKPLNYVPYVKSTAMKELENLYGWQPYPQKHFESRFTRFYEGYWLPERFGFDTRKVQYSSLILTEQMNRDDALILLGKPALPPDIARREFEFVAAKLEISVNELQRLFELPKKSYMDYPNSLHLFNFGAKVLKKIGIERSIKR